MTPYCSALYPSVNFFTYQYKTKLENYVYDFCLYRMNNEPEMAEGKAIHEQLEAY